MYYKTHSNHQPQKAAAKLPFINKSCFSNASAREQLGVSSVSEMRSSSPYCSVTKGILSTGRYISDSGCFTFPTVERTTCPVSLAFPKSIQYLLRWTAIWSGWDRLIWTVQNRSIVTVVLLKMMYPAYTKIFRIDGALSLKDWKSLIIFYFKGSPLTYEYFGVQEEYDKLLPQEQEQTALEQFIPYTISARVGLRIYNSSHHPAGYDSTSERWIINTDAFVSDKGDKFLIELNMLFWKDILEEQGGSITFPEGAEYVRPYHQYSYFPTVTHSGANTQKL